MRKNLPVTGKEFDLADSDRLTSRTDLRGVITRVNQDFVRVSGFTEAELIGQPHNLIRHPDMPAAAFADFWATLQAGRPWVGLVKNRRKNGDHYWVEAQATPVYEDGKLAGYMSVRRKASRERIVAAERDYATLRTGNSALRIRHGHVALPDRLRQLNPLWLLSLRQRMMLSGLGVAVFGGAMTLLASRGAGIPLLLGMSAIATAMTVYSMWWLSHDVVDRLDDAVDEFRHIAGGDYGRDIRVDRDDEVGRVLMALKSMQIRQGFLIEDQTRRANEAIRIRRALDAADANVMVADHDHTIVYANPSMLGLLRTAQSDLRQHLPEFDADHVIGRSIDLFHRDPTHQHTLLDTLQDTHHATIRAGGRTLDLLITPVRNERDERIGVVTEWRDRTVELALEREVQELVDAAARGDLGRRLALDDKQGFLRVLSQGIHRLLEATSASLLETRTVLSALADGDLRPRIASHMEGVFGELKDSTNATLDHLDGMVATIRDTSTAIDHAAAEIAAGNDDLSRRTEQQAASLEETAASMQELTSTVRQNAQSAGEANRLAHEAAAIAADGGQVVGNVVQSMQAIRERSDRIADIIGVIDGIAFQTNILALNAAVEAARAGEEGRGFAVVAGEVRALAQRSAAAAREIKQLITDSVAEIRGGATLAQQAGATMDQVVGSIRQVSELVAGINAASREQSMGIEQVNQAVMQMEETTQQNAALVEQAAAAAASMADQSAQLQRTVAEFRLAGTAA
ncbi:methyl-accepting chemotaxis protein [Aerolutibacter ruishenii]|uniref:Methyl-accepting chemotaxis sensory transducer with Pas/Pac sensor n=1 Tax=Aerolutibacter ruishenii TaxID=686800 RepID=A0A562LK57_9GAMM|nr:methyl-accepting chemotaxis protein [Lysobacter ruishenii]TWI07997.1 methyl-accepting chemotaxis sensory transducer with Pas/Pac sensor [Lysobacter ruishenii]